jgi:hypothetical protein
MPGLSDALGDRLLMFDNTATASLELLRLRRDLSDLPVFEAAVRQRLRALERFDNPGVARVRAFKSLGVGEGLALVSAHTVGQRLSEVLHAARGPALGLDLIRQLTPVLADLQGQGDDIAHGILTPERIIITPGGRLVMVEHVLGSALQAAGTPAHRLRAELGLVARAHDGLLGRRGDVVQLGLAALSLVLGRRIDASEYPMGVAALLDELELIDAPGASDFARLRRWMQHALQFGGRTFGSAAEAHEALREALGQRDTAPRENVIAFPAPAPDVAIEITSSEVTEARLRALENPEPRLEPDLDVAAMWRAVQAHATRGYGATARSGAPLATDDEAGTFNEFPTEYAHDRMVRLTVDEPRAHWRDLFAWLFRRGRRARREYSFWQTPGLAQSLAVLSLLQAGLLAVLLAVPPPPERIVVTEVVEVPAGARRPQGAAGERGRGVGVSSGQQAAASDQVAAQSAPQQPPTFTENLAQGLREAPAAVGRGAAAVWHAATEMVSDVYRWVRERVR